MNHDDDDDDDEKSYNNTRLVIFPIKVRTIDGQGDGEWSDLVFAETAGKTSKTGRK